MKAILLATGDEPGIAPLNDRYPASMLPLLDRPFIQHVVECLSRQGISELLFVLNHFPEKLESCLGDGSRWGARVTYQLARDAVRPYRLLKSMSFVNALTGPVLLVHADRLPAIDLPTASNLQSARLPLMYSTRPEGEQSQFRFKSWSGWSVVSPEQIQSIPPDADELALFQHLSQLAKGAECWVEVASVLDTRSFQAILDSHHAVLDKKHTGLLLSGREVEPGVWLSRNVTLHPTAQIAPPVYLAENCQVGLGVKLGPYAVAGNDCLLDEHCTVTQSVIYPGSYLGEALELSDVIVDKNRLINVRVGAAVTITDNFILGSMSERHVRSGLQRLLSQAAALLLVIVTAPLLAAAMLVLGVARAGRIWHHKTVVKLPTSTDEMHWRTYSFCSLAPLDERSDGGSAQPLCCPRGFICRFVPALWNIAKGQLCFVGVPPRSAEEMKSLTPDWLALYVETKAGIVTEADVRYYDVPNDDEKFMAEAFYAATASWHYDLRLLMRFFLRSMFGWMVPRRSETPAEV